MTHHPDQTYSLTDLRSYCLASSYITDAERLGLYLALQRKQERTAEDLETHVDFIPSFLTLPASYAWPKNQVLVANLAPGGARQWRNGLEHR
jgi:hypothetical protein